MTSVLNGMRPSELLGARLVPVLTALVALSVYLATQASEIGPGDSAELALQAYQLGVTHPPGYPLHTWLGWLASLLAGDPAHGTVLLSVVASAVAVGILCFVNISLTGSVWASVLASLLFAFAPTVWKSAVITEVYNVNVCFLALAIWISLYASARCTVRPLIVLGAVLGLSLGAGPANLLLLPGFAILAWQDDHRWFRRMIGWLGLVAAVGAAVLSWSYFRSKSIAPLGATYVPDTFVGFRRYLQASQYFPVELPPIRFYLNRLCEHANYWAASFLWIGALLGLIGLASLWRRQRRMAVGLMLMFVANAGIFTWHTWQDYKDMTVPSCLVFSIWVACGARALAGTWKLISTPLIRTVLLAALGGGSLYSGLHDHWTEQGGEPVTEFVQSTFEALPTDAVVVAEWVRFTPLLYFQKVEGQRPDLRIIERAEEPRQYDWGTVVDWRTYAVNAARTRPVVVDALDPALSRSAPLRNLSDDWYLIDRTRNDSHR